MIEQALESPDTALVSAINHGSGAGSDTRTGDDATRRTSCSPLGGAIISDDAALAEVPASKRRNISPMLGVIPPAIADGGDERSLELSSNDSMDLRSPASRSLPPAAPRAGKSSLPSRPRTAYAKTGRARSLSTSGVRLQMKRGQSPLPRAPLRQPELVVGCRAEGAQDTEARLRTLEEQQTKDHVYITGLHEFINGMDQELKVKGVAIKEMEQYLREVTASAFTFQKDVATTKASITEVKASVSAALRDFALVPTMVSGAVDVGVSTALDKMAVTVEQAFGVLEIKLAQAFQETKEHRGEDQKVVEAALGEAKAEFAAVKGLIHTKELIGTSTYTSIYSTKVLVPGVPAVFTEEMFHQIKAMDQNMGKNVNNLNIGQGLLTARLDIFAKLHEDTSTNVQLHIQSLQSDLMSVHGTVQSMAKVTASQATAPGVRCSPCGLGVSGDIGFPADEAAMPKPLGVDGNPGSSGDQGPLLASGDQSWQVMVYAIASM